MYSVEEKYKDCRVYGDGKKPYTLGDATQKTLKSLYVRGHPGITFKQVKKEQPPEKVD
jgi:hypothetical protein